MSVKEQREKEKDGEGKERRESERGRISRQILAVSQCERKAAGVE